jgi:hypothetical protein
MQRNEGMKKKLLKDGVSIVILYYFSVIEKGQKTLNTGVK